MNALRGDSKRLLNLINYIIDTSKIDSGSYRIDKKRTDIVSLVEDTELSMVEFAEVNGLEIIVDPEIEELFINCDKLDIERCIINLHGGEISVVSEKGKGSEFIIILPIQ